MLGAGVTRENGVDNEDIEELLHAHAIRNPSANTEPSGPPEHYYVPLLLADVLKANIRPRNGYDVFNGAVSFQCCMIYGRILGTLPNKYRYILNVDDNTAISVVSINKSLVEEELRKVQRLQGEVAALASLRSKASICARMRRLLAFTREQLNYNNIELGSKVLVFGVPALFNGKIGVRAYHVCMDNRVCRDMEIAFKEELIDFYMDCRRHSKNAA